MVADLHPPAGVTATPSGLAARLGMELVDNLQANPRQTMTLVALAGVFLWLLLVTRSLLRSLLPLIPVALSVGLATMVLYGLGIVMTPLTTGSGPMTIAVTTEFSVLLMYRYLEERAAGRSPTEAVEGCTRIGRAFVASGLTLLGGFGVLMLSPLPLLIDFGIVVTVIVVVALLCALIVIRHCSSWWTSTAGSRSGCREWRGCAVRTWHREREPEAHHRVEGTTIVDVFRDNARVLADRPASVIGSTVTGPASPGPSTTPTSDG